MIPPTELDSLAAHDREGSGNTKTDGTLIERMSAYLLSREGALARTRVDAGSSVSQPLGGFAQDDPRVTGALEAYLGALHAGHPVPRDEFLAQHAEIADALGECLSGLEFIQAAAAQLGASDPLRPGGTADNVHPNDQLGDFRILRELGRGGMGVVYEAEQISLGRRVALKVLPFAAAIDPRQRQRFQIEAQAAAQLHHPHIVPVFGVGCDRGIHYYAMHFVEGRSLAVLLHELRSGTEPPAVPGEPSTVPASEQVDQAARVGAATVHGAGAPAAGGSPRSPRPGTDADATALEGRLALTSGARLVSTAVGPMHQERPFFQYVARLGAEAADALDHAHGLGILHRDIKPANLLVDPQGSLWITDFGLARLPSDLSLTRTGDVVGTLRYMSPEQALARRGVVDQRTDVYSLGVTLYELLTLRPAFDGRDHQELLRHIALDEPIAPRRSNPAVPRDLETIVLKAMAKEPSGRYATAQDLAADLRRFLDDRPILARRPGMLERTLRWARRRKELLATAAAIFLVALTVSTAAIWNQARKLALQAHETELANQRRVALLIESYSIIHRLGTDAIVAAIGKLFPSRPGAEVGEEASQILDQWLRFFRQAVELPPNDKASREVIARAYSRLGYTHWMMSLAKATDGRLEPEMLAEAQAEYRRSIDLLDKLLADAPHDPKIRRYLSEALGLGNMGCCLRSALQMKESESLYRRAMDLRRDLLCGAHSDGMDDVGAEADLAGQLDDLPYLVSTAHLLAALAEHNGNGVEAERLHRQLKDDVVAVAARLSDPKYLPRRRAWAAQLTTSNLPLFDSGNRRDVVLNQRLALVLDPDNGPTLNNLAWSLASVPGEPWFDPTEALALARKAVANNPGESNFLNTLGVAAFRAGDWKTAAKALRESMARSGGEAYDLFFLAMTSWHQGNKQEAREFYDRAVAWTDKFKPNDAELRQFRAEAASLLGLPTPKPQSAGH
jgi:serine/threonine protein kinase